MQDTLSITPLISFIIPIYNSAKYLTECIESILSQSISKEIILINDGSTDNSLEIALKYSNQFPFLTVIHSQNKGAAAVRNLGIRCAKGKYLFFVDSDDYLLGDFIGKYYNFAEQYQADLIKFQAQISYEEDNDNIFRLKPAYPEIYSNFACIMQGQDCLEYMTNIYWCPTLCWTLIKRELLINNQLFFIENNSVEDQVFYAQLLTCQEQIKVLECSDIIYHYRKHNNSVTMRRANAKFIADHIQAVEILKRWIEEHHFKQETILCLNKVIATIYNNMIQNFIQLTEEDCKQVKHYLTDDIIQFIHHYLPDRN